MRRPSRHPTSLIAVRLTFACSATRRSDGRRHQAMTDGRTTAARHAPPRRRPGPERPAAVVPYSSPPGMT
ncbi:hypothetical protein FHS42_000353 [Streptomyces zagrosensis]|uniref:Uncharacterized protein n=1 Tax=Streptomyces zagrosensis TaxID=1042984 RepID=A0A7W9Q4A3_9ACTN|nr:hypothetical protein [Streptomyces zagrosensis]